MEEELQSTEDNELCDLAVRAKSLAIEAKNLDKKLNQLSADSLEGKQIQGELARIRGELAKSLNQLAKRIFKSKRLKRLYSDDDSFQENKNMWNEALNITVAEICQNIEKYKPDKPLLAWVNKVLPYRFKDVKKKRYPPDLIKSLDDLDKSLAPKDRQKLESKDVPRLDDELLSDGQKLRQYIQKDSEGRLNEHIEGRPKVTFIFLLLARLDGKTWKEIAKEIEPPPIAESSLNSFFNRQLRKLKNYLQNCLYE